MPTLYRIRIYKNYAGSGKRGMFSNTYEISTDQALDSPEMLATVNAFVNCERQISMTTVVFDRAVVSYLHAGDVPNNSGRFRSVPLNNAQGMVVEDAGDDQVHELPAELCLVGEAGSGTGRTSRHLYRGAVRAAMYKVVSGEAVLIANMDDRANIFTAALIGKPGFKWVTVHKKNGAEQGTSDVTQFGFTGIEAKQRTNNRRKKSEPATSLAGIVKQVIEGQILLAAGKAAWNLIKARTASTAIPAIAQTLEEELIAAGVSAAEAAAIAAI
jgi:hypothetical protein